MSEIELYVHPTCTSCRNAQAWLDERAIAYERRDFFRDRFTRDELETLFADGFSQPLEPGVLDMIDARTEGWAACIQLLQSTLRDMRAIEIRRFVEHL